MEKKFLVIVVLIMVSLASCKEKGKQKDTDLATKKTEVVADEIIKRTSISKDGKELEMEFNNAKGTLTLNLNGNTIELVQQKSASGIWYTNEDYELRGKGNNIELKKGNEIVFVHHDEITKTTIKNKAGQTLLLIFNSTTNEAKAYLNGGEQVDLIGQNPESGFWYKNEHYELKGNDTAVVLTQDGKAVFEK